MALGPGFGEGFTSGLQAGADVGQNVIKRQALVQDQINSKLDYYSSALDSMIKTIILARENAPQDDTNLAKVVAPMQQHVQETIQGIQQLPFDKARILALSAGNALASALQTPTKSQAAVNDFKAKYGAGQQEAKSLGYNVPDLQDANAGMAAAQQGQLPQEITPAPQTPSAQPPQQMAQSSPAGQPSPQAAQPSAPSLSDQAAAAPSAPQTAPQKTAPAQQSIIQPDNKDWNHAGVGRLNTGAIPVAAIEYLVANPSAAPAFQAKYGVDPTQLLSGPPKPGGTSTGEQIMKTALGIKENSLDKALADQSAKQYMADSKAADDAKQLLQQNAVARELLHPTDPNTGRPAVDQNGNPVYGIYAGITAPAQLTTYRVLKDLHMTTPEMDKKIADTQAYIATLTGVTAKIIKNFGSGTGLSDADREFAARAAGQDITFTPQALERILDINSRAAIYALAHPDQAKPGEWDSYLKAYSKGK